MENAHLYDRLTDIFREVFDDDSIALTPETTALDIKDWDSAAHVSLVVSIEERMGIKFKSSELEALHNVGGLVGILEYKLEQQ